MLYTYLVNAMSTCAVESHPHFHWEIVLSYGYNQWLATSLSPLDTLNICFGHKAMQHNMITLQYGEIIYMVGKFLVKGYFVTENDLKENS